MVSVIRASRFYRILKSIEEFQDPCILLLLFVMSSTICLFFPKKCLTWFGQHESSAGYIGGATRFDGSSSRQSPIGIHGGLRHVSGVCGTQTSWFPHLVPFGIKQLSSPHHRSEQRGTPFEHTQKLQRFGS